MKYLKYFENIEDIEDIEDIYDEEDEEEFEHYTNQNVGDYIKIDENESEWNIIGTFAKIIEVENSTFDRNGFKKVQPSYKVIGVEKDTYKIIEFWIEESEVNADLTEDEIRIFDFLLTAIDKKINPSEIKKEYDIFLLSTKFNI